jgi:hypothetical protein
MPQSDRIHQASGSRTSFQSFIIEYLQSQDAEGFINNRNNQAQITCFLIDLKAGVIVK